MGHEYAGIVEEVGAEVQTIKPGQFVVGSFWASDHTCEVCRQVCARRLRVCANHGAIGLRRRRTATARRELMGARANAVAALDRASVAVGRGLVAGLAGTAAMTVASTAEMKLRGRPPSTAPADVAGRLLGVESRERAGARFATSAHLAAGVSLGAVRGLLDLLGVRGPPAAAAFFWISWTPDLVVVPAVGAAEPPWRWSAAEVAISAAHHVVYAAAGESAYRWLAAS
jgi:hypothetical protein